jgi:hypothetical protein
MRRGGSPRWRSPSPYGCDANAAVTRSSSAYPLPITFAEQRPFHMVVPGGHSPSGPGLTGAPFGGFASAGWPGLELGGFASAGCPGVAAAGGPGEGGPAVMSEGVVVVTPGVVGVGCVEFAGGVVVVRGPQSPFVVTEVRNAVSPRVTITLTVPAKPPGIVAGSTVSAACPSIVPLTR